MKRVLVFGGATEGRLLCERMAGWPVAITVCVATDYGKELLTGLPDSIVVQAGQMDLAAMTALMREGYDWVVDATHPYATLATQTICAAAQCAGLPYYRLKRPESGRQAALYVASVEEAAAALAHTEGSILATTGVKALDAYATLDAFAMRVYARVLPTMESIARCEALGLPRSHIIAMQGPFSQALNEALIRQLGIRWLVTKDGGNFGGFMAKVGAAERCGIGCIIIGRPPESAGFTLEEMLIFLEERL